MYVSLSNSYFSAYLPVWCMVQLRGTLDDDLDEDEDDDDDDDDDMTRTRTNWRKES